MRRARVGSATILAAAMGAALAGPASAEPRLFVIDGYNAQLTFSCDVLGMLPVEGGFTRFLAMVSLDEAAPGEARAMVRVDADSMTLSPSGWLEDLRGPDFFDVDRYPEFGFESYSAELLEPGLVRIDGKLTMRGVAHPLSLYVRYEIDQRSGDAHATIEAAGEVDRTQYGMDAYDFLLSDDVSIEVGGTMSLGFPVAGPIAEAHPPAAD